MMGRLQSFLVVLIVAVLSGCASLPPGADFPRTVSSALAHPEATRLGRQFEAAAREHDGAVLIDFKVEQEDTVYPMVAAGASLNDMIRRPSPIVETAADE